MLEMVKERLKSFGYEPSDSDEMLLAFSIQKAENTIKNDCNITEIPNGLMNIAVDMAVGEFLSAKKTFAPDDISSLNLEYAVKQIQAGDTSVSFAAENSQTSEQRFDSFLNYLLNHGKCQFSCYRRMKW